MWRFGQKSSLAVSRPKANPSCRRRDLMPQGVEPTQASAHPGHERPDLTASIGLRNRETWAWVLV